MNLEDAPKSHYVTKYSALTTLESGSDLRDLLEILEIGDPLRPFATAEKLADLGVREIARRLAGNETLGDLLGELDAVGDSPATVNETAT